MATVQNVRPAGQCPMNPSHQSELLNTVLQFHDSEVSCVESVKGDVHVSFSAAHVQRSHGTPGRDVSHGYAQAVELCLYQAAWSGILNECVGSLSEGELKVDGCAIKRVVNWSRFNSYSGTFLFRRRNAIWVANSAFVTRSTIELAWNQTRRGISRSRPAGPI